jgi:hypothetical protein
MLVLGRGFEGNAASLDTTDRDIKEAAGALYYLSA